MKRGVYGLKEQGLLVILFPQIQINIHNWDKYTPQPDDLVVINGYLKTNLDIYGKPFYTIEVISLNQST